jgi:hypothetical protein
LHGELAAQSRRGICRPYDLAHGFIAAALHHHEVSDVGWTRTKQPCSARVDVIGTGHLGRTAAFLPDQTPSHGKRQMNQLSCEQAVRWRRFGFAGQEIPLPLSFD